MAGAYKQLLLIFIASGKLGLDVPLSSVFIDIECSFLDTCLGFFAEYVEVCISIKAKAIT